jgi:hypothetical protein
MSTTTLPASFDIGKVLGNVYGIVQRNIVMLLLFGLAIFVAGFVLQMVLMIALFAGADASARSAGGPMYLLAPLFGLLFFLFEFVLLQVAVIHAASCEAQGRKAKFGETLSASLPHILPVAAVMVISGVSVFLGLMVFVVPGILIAIVWYVATAVQVVENTGVFASFSRSADLTRGCRWSIFAVNLLVGIINTVVFYVSILLIAMLLGGIGLATGMAGAGANAGATPGVMAILMAIVLGVAYMAFIVIFVALNAALPSAVYIELRRIKEGGANIAAVFS